MSTEQETVSIDVLAPQKSLIDFSNRSLPTDFGLSEDYLLSKLMGDAILVEYVDIIDDGIGGMAISRGGIALPISHLQSAWRKGKVVLAGPKVQYTQVGDIVMFPSNMGIGITNLEVEGYGKVKNGYFINEDRMFGVCKLKDNDK